MNKKNIYFSLAFCFFIIITRLIPHPPNFNSSIFIAFYLPCIFGRKFIILSLCAFMISDFLLGLHQFLFFTWGSIFLIGYLSIYFNSLFSRSLGVLSSCLIFFLLSNFGVWLLSGYYQPNFGGLIECYYMALPFLKNSLIGNLLFAIVIEYLVSFSKLKEKIRFINPAWKVN